MSYPPPQYFPPPHGGGPRRQNRTLIVLSVVIGVLAILLIAAIIVVSTLVVRSNNEAAGDAGSSDPHAEWYDDEYTDGEGPIVDAPVESWTGEDLISATCKVGYFENGQSLSGAQGGGVCFGPISGSGIIYYGAYGTQFEAENDAAVGGVNGYILEPLDDGRYFMVAGDDADTQLQPLVETYGLTIIPVGGY